MRIAVVEDDFDLLQVATVVLRRGGHMVLAARDGGSGIQVVRGQHPDLVLLDLMLPDRDGFEVLEDLRSDGLSDRVPVVVLSALVGAEDRRRALELGAVASVTKPFDSRELLDLVTQLDGVPPDELAARRTHALASLAEDGPDTSAAVAAADLARLAGVLDLSVDAIVSVDEEQRVVGFNRGAVAMFGYARDEILGERLDRLLPDELGQAHGDHIRDFSRSAESSRHVAERREIHGRRRDGSLFPAEASILKHVVNGRPTFTAVLRDVSERRELIDELRARARQQAAVADLGQRALAGTTRDAFLREVAHTVATTLGVEMVLVTEAMPDDRLAVRASVGLEHEPTTVPAATHLHDVVRAGTPIAVGEGGASTPPPQLLDDRPVAAGLGVPLVDPRRTFGALGVYSARARSFSEDDLHFLQAVANVVIGFVERERVEGRLRRFLDAAPDATLVVADDGRIVSANPRAEELLGYPSDQLVGRLVEELVPDHSRGRHVTFREGYASEPRVRTMGAGRELSVLHADGSEIAVDIMLSPIETDEGLLVVAALRDVTDRRRNEAMRDAFLRAVSHDLRTPLAALIGYASLVVEDDSIRGDSRTYLERVVASGQKLERLLTDLLDLDRLSRGVLEPNRRPTDLAEVARGVVASLELASHDVDVVGETGGTTPDVDPAQIERILENLLANVARHTPAGTPCRVVVSGNGSTAQLVVEDEGPGVPDDVKSTIFDPFQRGNARDHSPGTGIGLSLVARFAELHGGHARVEDRPGGGARFVVTLQSSAD